MSRRGGRDQCLGHHQIGEPQAGHQALAEPGEIEGPLGCQRRDRPWPAGLQRPAGIVLEDHDVVTPRHLDQRPTSLQTHAKCHRIEAVWHNIQYFRAPGHAGTLECLRQHPLAIHLQTSQPQPKIARKRRQGVVTQLLRHHQIAGGRDGHESHRHRRGVAVSRQHAIGPRRHPAAFQPADGSLAMALKRGLRPEREHRLVRQIKAQVDQRRLHARDVDLRPDRLEHRAVDHPVAVAQPLPGGAGLDRPGPHEGAASDLSGDDVEPGQLFIGASDRLHAQIHLPGQVAVCRQPVAGPHLARLDRFHQGLSQRPVDRPCQGFTLGGPDCHDFQHVGNRDNRQARQPGSRASWRVPDPLRPSSPEKTRIRPVHGQCIGCAWVVHAPFLRMAARIRSGMGELV